MSASGNKRPRLAETSGTGKVELTLGEQMADLLRRNSKNYDVTFIVGPAKVKVGAVKFVLKAASPIFEKAFDEEWESLNLKEGEGISVPNIDPTAFKLFVNLLILDTWSLDSIKALQLSPNNLFSLLWLCRHYEITKAINNLKEAAGDLIKSFDPYTQDCLEISRENLETIFSFENLSLDENEIFECACRWANNQCTIKKLDPTGDNFRKVLGDCLFEIRFPIMSNEEFTKVSLTKNDLLKDEEKLAIYEYIGLDAKEKAMYEKSQLKFKTTPRVDCGLFEYSVLTLPQQFKLTTNPPFVCDGSRYFVHFQVSQRISLHTIGFLGPIDEDTHFEVSVQISRNVDGYCTFESRVFKKNTFARKGKTFHFILDESVIVEPSTCDSSWENYYTIFFWLKGINNIPQYKVQHPTDDSVKVSGVEFYLAHFWNKGNPLAELRFKKI